MKDNKYAPYILGPIVLLVWSLIFYKIYQAVYGSADDFAVPTFESIPVFEGPQKEQGFALLLDYKDPFFGKNVRKRTKVRSNTNVNYSSRPRTNPAPKVTTPVLVKTTTNKPFPSVRYQGFFIAEMDTAAAIKINKRFIPLAKKGQVMDGVQILGIYPDSIQLVYEGQQKTFPRIKQ